MSDRHDHWQRVEPGTVIPAGQPYRVEYDGYLSAQEYTGPGSDFKVGPHGSPVKWFIDSSWKPPLVLPTEPTWGIAVESDGHMSVGRWILHGEELQATDGNWIKRDHVLDFIPVTDEQVQRIEAAR